MENRRKNILKKIGAIQLPFIKIKVDNKQHFNKDFVKKNNEIALQAYKLLSCFDNLKIKNFSNKELKKNNNLILNYQPKKNRIIPRQLSKCIISPEKYKIIKIKATKSKDTTKILINHNDLIKDKYNRYKTKLKEKEKENGKLFSCNNISFKNLNHNNTNNEIEKKYKKYFPSKNKKSLKTNNIEENKNSNSDLFITNILNIPEIDDLKLYLKIKKEQNFKMNLLIKDTKENIDEIDSKLRNFDKNSRKNSPKSLRNLDYIINKNKKENQNEINYKKLFHDDKNGKNDIYTKICLSENKLLNRNNYSYIKKSTADLIKYYQSLKLFPDDYFYKERKRIIKQYPILEKEANLPVKSLETSRDSDRDKYNNLIEKNCKIINNMVDNNIIIYNKVLKKKQ